MKLELTYKELMHLLPIVNCELKAANQIVQECPLVKDDIELLESLKVKLTQLLDNI